MDWLERLPWWVKLCGGAGGVLLTAFANRLPEAYQTLGLVVGLSMLTGAGIGFLLHVIKEWRGGKAVEPSDVIILGVAGIALFAVITLGALIWQRTKQSSVAEHSAQTLTAPAGKIATSLRLQFGDANSLPVGINLENVWRWYALKHIAAGIDKKGKLQERVMSWTLFIVFDNPITIKQLRAVGVGSALPSYEVKDLSDCSAVVVFGGDLVGTTFDIQIDQ